MNLKNSHDGWGIVARGFHWLTAVLVLFMLGLGIYMVRVDDLFRQFELYQLHKSVGLVVLALMLLRLAWRLQDQAPPPIGRAWERKTARAVHIFLYAALLIMPVTGFLLAAASPLEIPTMFFGVMEIPHPIEPDEDLEQRLILVHSTLAYVLGGVVAVHVAAALKHHILDRDATLRRMLRGN
ncbi:MAG: cytochrome b [Aquisalimonadaceae bacterium]